MPVFLEDPSQFSKERLKSELIAHNVALPPSESKKQEYLDLYLKSVDTKNAADFSSDEEEEQPEQVDSEQRAEEPDMRDLSGLTDEDLKARLLQHGYQAGPITATTRYVYETKLKKLMESQSGRSEPQQNGSGNKATYSDSEEEEDEEREEEQPDPSMETVEYVEKNPTDSKMETNSMDDCHWFPQCFMPPTRLVKQTNGVAEHTRPACSKFSLTKLVEEIERRQSRTSKSKPQLATGRKSEWRPKPPEKRMLDKFTMTNASTFYTSPNPTFQHQTGPQVPVTDVLMESLPEKGKSPTGISATPRRPIKGAAGRPVKFKYADIPLSPSTLDQQEVQRRQVPLWLQLVAFLVVTLLLYVTYLAMENMTENPLTLLLDDLNQVAETVEETLAAPSIQEDAPLLASAAVPPLSGE